MLVSRSGRQLTGRLADADNETFGVARISRSVGYLEFTIEPQFSIWDDDKNLVEKHYRGTYLRHNQHNIWEKLKAETWEEAEVEAFDIIEAKYSDSISRMTEAKRDRTKVKPLSVAEIRTHLAVFKLPPTDIAQWAMLRLAETRDEDARAYLLQIIESNMKPT